MTSAPRDMMQWISTFLEAQAAELDAARNTRLSKTSDFGSGCSADGNLIIEATVFDRPSLNFLKRPNMGSLVAARY